MAEAATAADGTEVSRTEARSRPWWREWQFGLLLLLTACFFSLRVTALSVRGEESRRGRIAWEIWQNGDWIVPRIQGEPVFFRPPLQNWLIALVGMAAGTVDAAALRIPSVVAILLIVSITYGYARSFLSRFGAFFCGAVARQPGTSAGTGPAGRDRFALHALSGRLALRLEMVRKHRRLALHQVVPGLCAGGLGDADQGTAGAPLFRRLGVDLLPDDAAVAPAVFAPASGRHRHGTGHRRRVAGSLHDEDGAWPIR